MLEHILSTVVVAALVSATVSGIFNVVISSKIKKNLDISTFRYTKLYELNVEIHSLPDVNYDLSDTQRLVNQSTEKFGRIKDIYNKAYPLIQEKYHNILDALLSEEEGLTKKMVEKLYSEKRVNIEECSLKDILLKRQKIEKAVKSAISDSLLSMLV